MANEDDLARIRQAASRCRLGLSGMMCLTLRLRHDDGGLPAGQIAELRLEHGRLVLGRGTDSDWVLIDCNRTISKRHCVIEEDDFGYRITDLSTNGVFLNDEEEPIGVGNSRMLRHGDRIRIGPYSLLVDLVEQDPLPESAKTPIALAIPCRHFDNRSHQPESAKTPESGFDGVLSADAIPKPLDLDRTASIDEFFVAASHMAAPVTHLTTYYPKEIKPEAWHTLLVYVHVPDMQSTVEADAKQRLEVPHGRRTSKATRDITRGAEIVIIPELPGCRFNPTSARLFWLEDWHRAEFRLQAHRYFDGFELGKAVNGRVAFYVESVLVGEVPIWTCISDEADTTAADVPANAASAQPYEAIFVSYAHEDSAVVDRLGRAYKMLGMELFRDVDSLRSGEEWNPALLAQLYWSRAAKQSHNVEEEWRHALRQSRSNFIRPIYWQLPMPEPPPELVRLHFSYLDIEQPFA